MKQPKRPTRDQKAIIEKAGLNWREWMVKWTDGAERFLLMNKQTGERKAIGFIDHSHP